MPVSAYLSGSAQFLVASLLAFYVLPYIYSFPSLILYRCPHPHPPQITNYCYYYYYFIMCFLLLFFFLFSVLGSIYIDI